MLTGANSRVLNYYAASCSGPPCKQQGAQLSGFSAVLQVQVAAHHHRTITPSATPPPSPSNYLSSPQRDLSPKPCKERFPTTLCNPQPEPSQQQSLPSHSLPFLSPAPHHVFHHMPSAVAYAACACHHSHAFSALLITLRAFSTTLYSVLLWHADQV